jgi:hypothetical protein
LVYCCGDLHEVAKLEANPGSASTARPRAHTSDCDGLTNRYSSGNSAFARPATASRAKQQIANLRYDQSSSSALAAWEASAVSVRLHDGGPQGVKPNAEVVANILASSKERQA